MYECMWTSVKEGNFESYYSPQESTRLRNRIVNRAKYMYTPFDSINISLRFLYISHTYWNDMY